MERIVWTVGLPKKTEENDLDEYRTMNAMQLMGGGEGPDEDGMAQMVKFQIEQLKSHPEYYFNFGFTYNDFKAYLMKLAYCRAMRKFVERKRMQRIDDFRQTNDVNFAFFGTDQPFEAT